MVEGDHIGQSWADEMNTIVVDFFVENFPEFSLERKISHGPYWGVNYKSENIEIKIGGDIGFSVNVLINGAEYPLWQFDRSVNNALDTNGKNVLYQLNVLKKFLINL